MSPIKNLEKIQKEKQKHIANDKCHCNNANINTFPNNMLAYSLLGLNG